MDGFLPAWDVVTRHGIEVRAPRDRVWKAVRELDLARSRIVRILFRLRGLGRRGEGASLTLDGLVASGFVLLDERPGEEIVLGLVGRFWRSTGPVRAVAAGAFAAFDEPGWAKAVWGFSVRDRTDGAVLLATETRVHCTDPASRRAFLRYWRLVRPFSGLVRREALRIVVRSALVDSAGAGDRNSGETPTSP